MSGLTSAGLCQKSKITFVEAVEDWNRSIVGEDLVAEISINHYRRTAVSGCSFRILLLTEPSVTWPQNLRRREGQYDLVYSANNEGSDTICVPWFNTPERGSVEKEGAGNERGSDFTLIAANKLSFVPGELYSLRRQVGQVSEPKVVTYGAFWDEGAPWKLKKTLAELSIVMSASQAPDVRGLRSFFETRRVHPMGTIDKKSNAYSSNRYAVVIENSLELRTEKLYDALEAGALTVYVGPDSCDEIPSSLYVRSAPTLNGLRDAMNDALSRDFAKWSLERSKWLSSDSYLATDRMRFERFLGDASSRLQASRSGKNLDGPSSQ